MKEIEKLTKDQIAIVKQAEVKKDNKLVGRIKPKPGHIVFEINLETKEVKHAEFKEHPFVVGQANKKKIIQINEHCIYDSALNLKNLLRKIKKGV